jgi:predicted MFS family arabinose efflux permease
LRIGNDRNDVPVFTVHFAQLFSPVQFFLNPPALVVLMVLTHVTLTGNRVALALYAIHLKATPFEVGFLMSLIAVIPMFLSVHAGRWTDRAGVFLPMLISLCLMITGAIFPALRSSLGALYCASILLGSGFMLANVAINNAIGHASTPETRTSAFSLLALGFSLSTVTGPMIAGFIIDFQGFTAAFLTLAAFSSVALIALFVLHKARIPSAVRRAPAADLKVIDLLRHSSLRAVFIVSGLLSMGWDLFTFMVPIQGARIGLSASTIGLIMGAFGVGTFLVRLLMPRAASIFSEWKILTFALAITALVYLLFPLFGAVPVLLGLAFVLGLGLGSAMPMIMSLIYTTAPEGRTGEAVGVRSTLINASQTVLPLLFGALGSVAGTIPVFWMLAAMLALGGIFAGRRTAVQAAGK